MLIHCSVHQAFLSSCFIERWEKLSLLIVMMLHDAVNPSETISDKILLIGWETYTRSLLVYAIEASDESVVT